MRFTKRWGLGAVAAATLLALPRSRRRARRSSSTRTRRRRHRPDFGVCVTGGLNTYTGDLADLTGVGGSLGIMADTRPLPLLGLEELGYEGSRNPFENIDGGLWRHNVGAARQAGAGDRPQRQPAALRRRGLGVGSLNPSGAARDHLRPTSSPRCHWPRASTTSSCLKAGARATYSILGGEDLGLAEHGNNVNLGLNLGGSF